MTKNQVFRLRIDRKDAPTLFLGEGRSSDVLTDRPENTNPFRNEADAFTLLQCLIRPTGDAMRDLNNRIFTHEQENVSVTEATVFVEYARLIENKPGVWAIHHRGGLHVPRT